MRYLNIAIILLTLFGCGKADATNLYLSKLELTTWQTMRDSDVVKQNNDKSCGSASLATILTGFYNYPVTEQDILVSLENDGMASFSDLALVAQDYGFKGVGIALDYEKLMKLKIPVIVYLKYQGLDHFSVLRGISANRVWLGDPSWGNKIFSKSQFIQMWHTRIDKQYKGKALLILPKQKNKVGVNTTFFHSPRSLSFVYKSLPHSKLSSY